MNALHHALRTLLAALVVAVCGAEMLVRGGTR